MGKLIIVPTPIGNLGDMTYRAVETLRNADFILAEDTRNSSKLLKHFEIENTLSAYHAFNEHKILKHIIQKLTNDKTAALISDAGTPAISDPGFLIVRACIQNNIVVECLPGPVALIPALVCSGIPNERFCFEGFLPHKKGRLTRLKNLTNEYRTMVFYESPHRLVKTLSQLAEHLGRERRASVSKEISKIHEETTRGTLGQLFEIFNNSSPRGEYVIVVEGRK
jgi:16S rRNA (cytidine1402-2'-O)-methyltransferase